MYLRWLTIRGWWLSHPSPTSQSSKFQLTHIYQLFRFHVMYFHLVQINGVPPTIPPLCVVCLVWGNSPCCKTGAVALDHADNNNRKSTLHKSRDPFLPSLSLNLGNSNFPHPPTPLLGGIFVGGLVNRQVRSGVGGVLQGPWGGWSTAQG